MAHSRLGLLLLTLVSRVAPVSHAQAPISAPSENEGVQLFDAPTWRDDGVWLHGDLHVHRMLVGRKGQWIARAARNAGLDFVASTEHAHYEFGRARQTLDELRRRHPEIIILAGIEWNLPGGGHASVILDTPPDEIELLKEFANTFDAKVRRRSSTSKGERDDPDPAGRTAEALRWLDALRSRDNWNAVTYLNHPSRGAALSDERIGELAALGVAGIEAAPGHQIADPHEDDEASDPPPLIDRHEPFVAVIGGGYDQLLQRGRHLGLVAGSDFHSLRSSYPPGHFSRTLVYGPDRSPAGVLAGLASGATVSVLGGIVRGVETLVLADGSDKSARIGEGLRVPRGARLNYRVTLEVPDKDYRGRDNRLDRVEIISDCLGEPRLVHAFEDVHPGPARLDYALPAEATDRPGRCFLRLRGRRFGVEEDEPDLLFHTGATRIEIVDRPGRAPAPTDSSAAPGARNRGISIRIKTQSGETVKRIGENVGS